MSKDKFLILIVEDDISSQQYYTTILDDEFGLDILPTAKDAKQVLGKKEYDLMIIDISLPGDEDGIDLMQYIRETLKKDTPMLVITANAFPQNRSAALRAGASEFFSKPILSGTLIEAIKKIQGRRS